MLISRFRKPKASEAETQPITTRERLLAVIRVALVALLAVRLARSASRLPKDIALLRTPRQAPTTA